MLPASILAKKRDGQELSEAEIQFLIQGFVGRSVADYQMTAFAMAVFFRGMTAAETAALTLAMLDSGDRLPRASRGNSRSDKPRVDKHSTGGLGDKVSLILAPLLACHDVVVPMVSGRGLGLTGGTLDKLESIPGFKFQLDDDRRDRQLDSIGCFIIGASDRISPADRQLYALRDVTATVESVPLITASILSKKLAASLDHLVMDVKVGSAAFMKNRQQATELANSLVQTGAKAGLPTTALLTDMDQPLGMAVGNAVEVNETLQCLEGSGPQAVNELTVLLCAHALVDCERYQNLTQACDALWQSLHSGAAKERFFQMVAAQGGSLCGPLPLAPATDVFAQEGGFVESIDCERLGRCVVEMGGGRRKADDSIDPTVGLEVLVRIGDKIDRNQPLIKIYNKKNPANLVNELRNAIKLFSDAVNPRPLIIDTIVHEPEKVPQ
ncbi:MAG TPA: thymidine phosphorylase [Planctomycetaceae bacterium]|nr:thymidine phosphorylase [Planctomycetaceae bacterium]